MTANKYFNVNALIFFSREELRAYFHGGWAVTCSTDFKYETVQSATSRQKRKTYIFCPATDTKAQRKKAPFTFRTMALSLLIHANAGSGKIRKLLTATYARTMGTRA